MKILDVVKTLNSHSCGGGTGRPKQKIKIKQKPLRIFRLCFVDVNTVNQSDTLWTAETLHSCTLEISISFVILDLSSLTASNIILVF